jgi:hypothetical protein
MQTRLRPLIPIVAALGVLVLPSQAPASPGAVIHDCAKDGTVDGSYTKKDLRTALENLPTDLQEYSGCPEEISAAIGNTGGGDGRSAAAAVSGAGAPSGDEATARERDQEELARLGTDKTSPGSISIGDHDVSPGSDGLFDVASASNDMPLPLILALVGLALLTLAGSFVALRSRIPLLARISLPTRVRFPRLRR